MPDRQCCDKSWRGQDLSQGRLRIGGHAMNDLTCRLGLRDEIDCFACPDGDDAHVARAFSFTVGRDHLTVSLQLRFAMAPLVEEIIPECSTGVSSRPPGLPSDV